MDDAEQKLADETVDDAPPLPVGDTILSEFQLLTVGNDTPQGEKIEITEQNLHDNLREYNDLAKERRDLMEKQRKLHQKQKDLEFRTKSMLNHCPKGTYDFGDEGFLTMRNKIKWGSLEKKGVLVNLLFTFFNKVKPFKITDENEASRLAEFATEYAINNKPVLCTDSVIEAHAKKRKKHKKSHMVFPTFSMSTDRLGDISSLAQLNSISPMNVD